MLLATSHISFIMYFSVVVKKSIIAHFSIPVITELLFYKCIMMVATIYLPWWGLLLFQSVTEEKDLRFFHAAFSVKLRQSISNDLEAAAVVQCITAPAHPVLLLDILSLLNLNTKFFRWDLLFRSVTKRKDPLTAPCCFSPDVVAIR